MKILLIYPGLVEGFDSYEKRSNWFNHGVGIISSILNYGGHEDISPGIVWAEL